MSVNTKLAESILTSTHGKQIYDSVAEIYGDSYTSLWIMQAIGIQLDNFRSYTDEYLYQVTPESATWSIGYWEEEYGIIPLESQTLEQRRSAIMLKMLQRAPINPNKLEQIVTNMSGADCDVTERTSKNAFRVILRDNVTVEMMARIWKTIREVSPAHLIFDIRVSILFKPSTNIYSGIAVSQFRHYEVKILGFRAQDVFNPSTNIHGGVAVTQFIRQKVEVIV